MGRVMLNLILQTDEKRKIDKYFNAKCVQNFAVEAIIFDLENRWVLHKRGPACRDEKFLLEGIGGEIEQGESINEAIDRELCEEVGCDADIEIRKIIAARCNTNSVGERWGIISVVCLLIGGKLRIMEEDKNLGYKISHVKNVNYEELSSSTKILYNFIRDNQSEIMGLLK